MKKAIIISLISIISALFYTAAQSQSINISAIIAGSNPQSDAPRDPSTAPLPSTIKDPLLLKGWEYLYQQTEPIKLWDGHSLTGQQLAQLVITDRIVFVWDTKNICKGFSCAYRPVCNDAQCQAKSYPIYISPSIKDAANRDITSLAAIIAHEIFHYSAPFGWVADSQFEEYWAYDIQSSISNSPWKYEEQKDSLNPLCLHQWFVDHNMPHYFEHAAYPQSVSNEVEVSAEVCLPGFMSK